MRFRVNFMIGATVEAADEPSAFIAAKRELEKRYGEGVLFAIDEQTFPPVIYLVDAPK